MLLSPYAAASAAAYFTPELFGAIGDGVADDTVPIRKMFDAIKAQGGGTAYIPKKYKITTKYTFVNFPPCTIRGDNTSTTTVKSTIDYKPLRSVFVNGCTDIMFDFSGTVAASQIKTTAVGFEGIAFDQSGNTANGIAVNLATTTDQFSFTKCYFYKGKYAITSNGAPEYVFNIKCESTFFYQLDRAIYLPHAITSDYLNMQFFSCVFRYNNWAVYAGSGNSFYFRNNLTEANVTGGYYLDGVFHVHIDGDHFEQQTGFDVHVLATTQQPKIVSIDRVTGSIYAGQAIQIQVEDAARMEVSKSVFIIPSGSVAGISVKNNSPADRTFLQTENVFESPTSLPQVKDLSTYWGTWVPVPTGLTVVNGTGGATYAGTYQKIGQLLFFTLNITVTGTCTTASVLGTSFSNMPFNVSPTNEWTACNAIDISTGASVLGQGVCRGGGVNQIMFPAWGALNHNICISGWYPVA